jgi:hypothetical protein
MKLDLKQKKSKKSRIILPLLLLSIVTITVYILWLRSITVNTSYETPLDQTVSAEKSCGEYNITDQKVKKIVAAAKKRTEKEVRYVPDYVSIEYLGGDVPDDTGVCTDVIVRAYRGAGIDLQKEVHEDMSSAFNEYPSRRVYGLDSPDSNIDHRRVINLMKFFERKGAELEITDNPEDYLPGDIVVWTWGGGTRHIGIVVDEKSEDCERFKVVHNGGWGTVAEDRLFEWEIIGHYRY